MEAWLIAPCIHQHCRPPDVIYIGVLPGLPPRQLAWEQGYLRWQYSSKPLKEETSVLLVSSCLKWRGFCCICVYWSRQINVLIRRNQRGREEGQERERKHKKQEHHLIIHQGRSAYLMYSAVCEHVVSVPDPKPNPAQIAFSILEVIYVPDEVWGRDQ